VSVSLSLSLSLSNKMALTAKLSVKNNEKKFIFFEEESTIYSFMD